MRRGHAALIVMFASVTAAAQPADVTRAKELYKSAEAAMSEKRYDDAIRDYGGTYEITKDPTLFFKIASANAAAGKCETAVVFFRRYLKEGKPNEKFTNITRERIKGCNADPDAATPPPDGTGIVAEVKKDPVPETPKQPPPETDKIIKPEKKVEPPVESHGSRGAWLLIGGSITFITLGAVFAYAADSSEADIDDLYTFGGSTPIYDMHTKQRYEELIDQGERYQNLSRLSFGLAGLAAIGAGILFVTGNSETVTIAPTATGTSAGATAILQW